MSPLLRAVPKLCYLIAVITFVGQGYYVVRVMIRGVGLGYDVTREMWPQYAATWLEIFANSLVWFAFGLLASLLIRAIDDLKRVTSERSSGDSGDA